MTAYVRKFDNSITMSFEISDKQLLKEYNEILKRIKKLLEIKFDRKPVYGDNEKHIKKIRTYGNSVITNFHSKKVPKEKAPCIYLSIMLLDSRFCYWRKEKVLSSNTFRRMQIWTKKDRIRKAFDDDLEKSESDESDSDFNNEAESDIDNDE